MKRLFAVGALALGSWCAAAVSADLASATERHSVAVGAGFVNVATELYSAQLRQVRGATARMIDGLADAGAVAGPDALAAVYAGGSSPWRAYGSGYVVSAVHTGDGAYSNDGVGFLAGLERTFGAFTFGAAASYAGGDYDARRGMDQIDYHSWSGLLYGRWACGGFSLEGDVGYGRVRGDRQRRVGDGTTAKDNDHDLGTWFAALTAAYRLYPAAGWYVTPSVGIEYYHTKADGTRESARNPSALRYRQATLNTVRTPLMVTVEKPMRGFGRIITPYARVGITPEWHQDRSYRRVTRAADGVDTKIKGPKPVRWTGTAGVGVTAKLGMRADLSASYDFECGSRYRNNIFTLGAGVSF